VTATLPPRQTIPNVARDAGLRRLSLRETRVARLVAEGLSDEQVAARLGITVTVVSVELAEVLRKLGLRSRTELAFFASDETGAAGEGRPERPAKPRGKGEREGWIG